MHPNLPSAPRSTRRGFLRLLGNGAALAALARVPVAPGAARAAAVAGLDPGARFFDPDQTEILTQIIERMVDSGEADVPRVRDTSAVATVDALAGSLDPAITDPLPLLLGLVEWGPVLFDLRLARFTSLTDAEKDASLRGWMTSRFELRRLAFMALKNLAMLGWYSRDESWAAVGYAGPLLARKPS
jgi:hypothetical protein